MSEATCDLGMIGLGVMGRNFLLNLADHGFTVAGYDKDPDKVDALRNEGSEKAVVAVNGPEDLVRVLRRPRTVMMLVPAGPPVDSVIGEMRERLDRGDLIVDGGNSHFPDTDVRAAELAKDGIAYLGVGISGGEYGARHGPSIMPGGPREVYRRVAPMFEAAAAKVDGEPCVAYLGPGSAGHYVKMVHNGIEYGLMQLISEAYDLMKRGLAMEDDELARTFGEWNRQELSSYLIEITSNIFNQDDPNTHRHLIDVILDEARQKGTGMWASQDAMELQVPVPNIDVAVMMRHLSAYKQQREEGARELDGPSGSCSCDRETFLKDLRQALYAGMIITFTQGMALLRRASQERDYGLNLADVARIWRGGCIIRAALLDRIRSAYQQQPDLGNLLLDEALGSEVSRRQPALREVVRLGVEAGIPVPGLSVALACYDAYRSPWLPANLIEAQRDYFGSHTYERIDAKGSFHTQWRKPETPAPEQAQATAGGVR